MDGIIVQKISAKDIPYRKIITIFLTLVCIFIWTGNIFFILINHLIFLLQNLYKLYLLLKISLCKYKGIKPANRSIIDLKKYSILIPLYKEQDGIGNIVKAMQNLLYPEDLLEVKLIIEEDDKETLQAIQNTRLPTYFEIIKVPFSIPRTKPKALNYAMNHVTGTYVVIYDAEDRPEPNQLLKTSRVFADSNTGIICLQARLSFENKDQNIMTKFFEMEYRIWFDFLLPGIDKINMPIPLGGSSNHFKVNELRKIGLWDPYNVTEDADLGIRIYQSNFKTKIIDSITFEEAPFDLSNWLNQRSRWIKGFLQTFIVFLYNRNEGSLNFTQKIFVSIFLGFATYSFLILPFYCLFFDSSLLAKLNLIIFLIYMYLSSLFSCCKKSLTLILWPLYFTLHVIASYMALYQLFFRPFQWNKTRHYFHI